MQRTSKTINAYDKNCIAYSEKFMEFEQYKERMSEFIHLLDYRIKVLDLGCGPGNRARQLMLSGKELSIEGIDLSEGMIRLAQQNVPIGIFKCADIREISYTDEEFDAILLSFCIVHLNDTETAELLRKVAKYLKKDGKLYLSFMEGKTDGFEKTSFSDDEIYFCYHSLNRVQELLKENRLSTINVVKQGYEEQDRTITTEVFIFAQKESHLNL